MAKKWRLRKDIGTLKAGTVGGKDSAPQVFFPCGDTRKREVAFHLDFIQANPDIFEEVSERWRPKVGEDYFYMDMESEIHRCDFGACAGDNLQYEFGNCFPTESQAQEASRRVKETLMAYHRELSEKGEG
jgi:hypothetical protein